MITVVTLAVLRVEATLPVNIDELMILVIGSTWTSRYSFSIHVGSGSSVQDFVDEFMMIFLVVSGVIVEKFVNVLVHNCVGMSTDSCEGKASSRETCRSSILVLKNLLKASGKALSSMVGFFPLTNLLTTRSKSRSSHPSTVARWYAVLAFSSNFLYTAHCCWYICLCTSRPLFRNCRSHRRFSWLAVRKPSSNQGACGRRVTKRVRFGS